MRICLVEDNDLLREMLCSALSAEGFDVAAVVDGEEFSNLLSREHFDAFVVDLNLPGEDGLAITRRLKSVQPSAFVIMATARDRISDRVAGYDVGADIYMTKPVHVRELVAALRGHAQQARQIRAAAGESVLLFDDEHLRVRRGDVECRISPTEAIILKALIVSPSQRLDYWQLFEVLGKDMTQANKQSLEVHVVNVRKKLISLGAKPPAIQAIKGQGYCLRCEIEISPV